MTRPPRPIAPALAARLTGSSTGFLGTLFDLARRGTLRIEEGPRKWTGRTFEIVRLDGAHLESARSEHAQDLSSHEQVFFQALFHKAKADRTNLSEIGSLSYNSCFSAVLDEELVAAGWKDPERQKRRTRFLAWTGLGLLLGLLVLVVGITLAVAPQPFNTWIMTTALVLIGGGAAVSGVCLVGLLIAALISTQSDEGVRQATAWNSFAGYLRNITRGREPGISPDLFERYLPYAAAFGLATEWAKYFQKQAEVPVPEWFQGLQSSLDDGSFVAIMAAISSADSSASSAGGASGGGASGGGASGAG
ncbi:MAG: DUF2207 domain-containing protein [Chloroflexi bacterium]|nr:MAG: DUF2207 domain-containing protein [Chloroflexota bacterium]